MQELDPLVDRIRAAFEAKNAARDQALQRSRELIRYCANTIRAVHRQPPGGAGPDERREAAELLATARATAGQLLADLAAYPDLLTAGYTQDAIKEYAEAAAVVALVAGEPLPAPEALGVDYAPYLNGLAEAASELRRRALDVMRHGHTAEAERLLGAMDEIYSRLITIDFPDALTGGLRRTTDQLRAVLERTRGDVTNSMRQDQLVAALREFETRIGATGIGATGTGAIGASATGAPATGAPATGAPEDEPAD